ncbi:MAG: DUF3791 domain-containing protein [Clostridium sp.]|uniref:DUF3791 domain-containing protein n=1 Tax=uncultured Clostridium sp. TaxID=59620 RepID=UPI0025D30E6B|nr:DUF3791 domain-containing protein [uncultured Clostridium sp.]MCQ2969743.1 DUF3791 domain-containing protein [Clostridium sp.]
MNEKILEFSIFCVESLAEKLNIDAKKIYKILRVDTDILDNYIIPCYEALHSQSKAYIVDDLIQIMKVKGVL